MKNTTVTWAGSKRIERLVKGSGKTLAQRPGSCFGKVFVSKRTLFRQMNGYLLAQMIKLALEHRLMLLIKDGSTVVSTGDAPALEI